VARLRRGPRCRSALPVSVPIGILHSNEKWARLNESTTPSYPDRHDRLTKYTVRKTRGQAAESPARQARLERR
jgi:hypothetical protein